MDKDEILRLAREAFGSVIFVPDENGLLRFAALVAAQERERCAKVADACASNWRNSWYSGREKVSADACEYAAIREQKP